MRRWRAVGRSPGGDLYTWVRRSWWVLRGQRCNCSPLLLQFGFFFFLGKMMGRGCISVLEHTLKSLQGLGLRKRERERGGGWGEPVSRLRLYM